MTMTEDAPVETRVGAMIDVVTLKAIAVAASADQARPVLTCVGFVRDGDRWQVQATDSHVAAWTGDTLIEPTLLVNAKALTAALKTVAPGNRGGFVTITFTGEGIKGECTIAGVAGTMKIETVEGSYPRLENIVTGIKPSPTDKVGFGPGTMGKVVSIATLLGKESAFELALQSSLKPVEVRFCANPDVHMVVMPYRCS